MLSKFCSHFSVLLSRAGLSSCCLPTPGGLSKGRHQKGDEDVKKGVRGLAEDSPRGKLVSVYFSVCVFTNSPSLIASL